MNKVKVVTAYVDLNLSKRPPEGTHDLGQYLIKACEHVLGPSGVRTFQGFDLGQCWAYQKFGIQYPPANVRPPDRFATQAEHLRSNLVQHSPMQWLNLAFHEDPTPSVYVWLGYTLLKQGDFTGKRITTNHVCDFLRRLQDAPILDHIPFPGITPMVPVNPGGDNWRFCGSTLIVPTGFLPRVVRSYEQNMEAFVHQHWTVPIDLAIWPSVEFNSGLPWQQYVAEYDYTQLTNFPG